jgi:hypothetical protein
MSSATTGVTNALATSSDTIVLGPRDPWSLARAAGYDGLLARIRQWLSLPTCWRRSGSAT